MKQIYSIETVPAGRANGISLQLAAKQAKEGTSASLSEDEKAAIIDKAAKAVADFLEALGVDWENDPNTVDTPLRVAKSYVNDLWKGRYEAAPEITTFSNVAECYDGMVFEGGIPMQSMCSHHLCTILGKVHVAYIPGTEGKVIGLSKLNRIVEHFSRRATIQEQLTTAIHAAIDKVCEGNHGVAVMIEGTHTCVACRGVKHIGTSMITSKLSGDFMKESETRAEFYEFVGRMKHNNND